MGRSSLDRPLRYREGRECNINSTPDVLRLNMQFILTFAHDLSRHLHSPGLPFP